jgi:urease accessory protein
MGWLRIAADHVLARMLEGLARAHHVHGMRRSSPRPARTARTIATTNESGHGGRIHEWSPRSTRACCSSRAPTLPVGAYSYSQGLEAAVESRIVRDAASRARWIGDVLELSVASMEAPVAARLMRAWRRGDAARRGAGTPRCIASRETAELRAETVQMGYSLRRLLRDLDVPCDALEALDEVAYPTAFTFAASAWQIDVREALVAYAFTWIENQVLAAVKCVPLGQTDGQRLMLALGDRIEGSSIARSRWTTT